MNYVIIGFVIIRELLTSSSSSRRSMAPVIELVDARLMATIPYIVMVRVCMMMFAVRFSAKDTRCQVAV